MGLTERVAAEPATTDSQDTTCTQSWLRHAANVPEGDGCQIAPVVHREIGDVTAFVREPRDPRRPKTQSLRRRTTRRSSRRWVMKTSKSAPVNISPPRRRPCLRDDRTIASTQEPSLLEHDLARPRQSRRASWNQRPIKLAGDTSRSGIVRAGYSVWERRAECDRARLCGALECSWRWYAMRTAQGRQLLTAGE